LFDAIEDHAVACLLAGMICGKAAVVGWMPVLRGKHPREVSPPFVRKRMTSSPPGTTARRGRVGLSDEQYQLGAELAAAENVEQPTSNTKIELGKVLAAASGKRSRA
jgi:hypothetical protein